MTRGDIVLSAVLLVMAVFALIPMLARTLKMFFILAGATGLIVGLFWIHAFTADWDKDRMASAFVALVATTGWIVGVSAAALRLIGQRHGWWLARSPRTEVLVIGLVLTFYLVWLLIR